MIKVLWSALIVIISLGVRMPAQAATIPLSGFVVFFDNGTSLSTWKAKYRLFPTVYLDSGTLVNSDQVLNQTPLSAVKFIRQHRIHAALTISNYDGNGWNISEVNQLLQHTNKQTLLVQRMVALMLTTPFEEVNLDFEEIPSLDASRYVSFLSQLQQALHRIHRTLSVDIPAITPDDSWDGGYQETGIGKHVDRVLLMTYDYSYQGGPAGPIAPTWWVKSAIQFAEKHISLAKIELGLPFYGYDWFGKQSDALTIQQVDSIIKRYHITPKWNALAQAPYFTYRQHGMLHTVDYENALSIRDKLKVAALLKVTGVFAWYLGSEDKKVADIWGWKE